jgi:hypothetical protein
MEYVKVIVTCRCCGKTGQFSLHPIDACDWGWMMMKNIKECGFEISESSAYCNSCAKNYKRGPLNMLTDKER